MLRTRTTLLLLLMTMMQAETLFAQKKSSTWEVVETASNGHKLTPVATVKPTGQSAEIRVLPEQQFQTITGFGGSFTQSSAYLLSKLSPHKRKQVLEAYFGPQGARYSLTRTHINSCDFSLYQYAYAMDSSDQQLEKFNIAEDHRYLIPMIKAAQAISKDGFSVIASPWTAPPWMKDNGKWVGGKLKSEFRNTWALYFSKYLKAYEKEGIPIWAVTVINEPLGNGNNWESMYYTPKEMTDFVREYLGPHLEQAGYGKVKILGYDQNRGEELEEWVKEMYKDEASSRYFGGTAIHWYNSTFDYFPASLELSHKLAPGKHLINTEACIDAQVPVWKDDSWYWREEAKDWGWTWAPEHLKHLHPKYVPVFRYARDIIGCLNHHVDGWVDWNMVLDKQGGPNWFKNWCTAPVIVDPETDEVYFTPLYYTLAHFSKYIRPGARRLGIQNTDTDLQCTAARNQDGTTAIVLFNPSDKERNVVLKIGKNEVGTRISAKAIQTVTLKP